MVCRSQSGLQIKSTLYQSVRFAFLLPALLGFVCSCFQDFLFFHRSFSKQRRSTAVKIANIHIQQTLLSKILQNRFVVIENVLLFMVYSHKQESKEEKKIKNQNIWLFIVFLCRWVKFAVTGYLRTQNRSAEVKHWQ